MRTKKLFHNGGYSLIELMIAIALTAIVGIAVVSNYFIQKKSFSATRQVDKMQENLRGSMYIIERDVRMAGYDPNQTGNFGITDIRPWTVTSDAVVPAAAGGFNPAGSNPALTLIADDNRDQIADLTDDDGNPDPLEIISYRLYDDNNDGRWDLARDVATPGDAAWSRQLVAEGIEHIGFAYAIDNDDNGELDLTPGGNIIWAADSDWDGVLDTNLDTDDDGRITTADDTNSDQRITSADGIAGNLAAAVPLGSPFPVQLNRIRAVRIWILARTPYKVDDYLNSRRYYVVGDQIWPQPSAQTPFPTGFNDGIRRRLLIKTIECRNLG